VFDESPFQFLGATVNPSQLEVKFPSGTATAACRRTLGIMQYMAAHPNVVVTRKALLHAVWGVHANPRSRSLDQYIVKVRQMFISHGLDASAFRTVHSVGYFYRQQECPGPLVRG
jgi:DNA-binding response OmpR family regulator